MLLVKEYPCLDLSKPETHFYLSSTYERDNVFYGKTRTLKYKNSNCIFSIKSVLNGCIAYCINGREKMIEPGEFLIVTQNTSYECYIDSNDWVEDVCVQLTERTVQEVFQSFVAKNEQLLDLPFGNEPFSLDLKTISFTDESFFHLLRKIARYECDDLERDQLKHELLNYYFRNYYSEHLRNVISIENENLSTKLEIFKRINLAKDFLHSNYAQPIDLQQIAMAACISPSHLIRKFNEVFRTTPYQYLKNVRLKKAVSHLRETDLPVEQIAYNSGFESPSSFIRAFRETYSTTPNALRKQHKNNSEFAVSTPVMN